MVGSHDGGQVGEFSDYMRTMCSLWGWGDTNNEGEELKFENFWALFLTNGMKPHVEYVQKKVETRVAGNTRQWGELTFEPKERKRRVDYGDTKL